MHMNCPNCQTENRVAAHFCLNCGFFLDPDCPSCGNNFTSPAKFCDHCGIRLSNTASLAGFFSASPIAGQPQPETAPLRPTPEPASQPQPETEPSTQVDPHLQQYVPRELLDKFAIAREQGGMLGERRVVSILFCDVQGSTAAAEQLDPEEWTEIINGAFEHMISPIYKYEGIVARLMGIAILAFFGAPIAHEDDPRRAVLAGLEIVQSIQAYREQVLTEWKIDIDVRVGINTGPVVEGAVGSDLRMEYTAMGDAINLAARMEQHAEPGTVKIAEETFKFVSPLFDVWELGGVEVKGKAEPVSAYRVLGPKADPGRQRGIEGLDAPLIGRETEYARLSELLDGLEQGVGQILFVIGEAGLGKSRIIAELRKEWQQRFIQPDIQLSTNGQQRSNPAQTSAWYETASLSYETAQPYHVFVRLLRHVAHVQEGESNEKVNQKIDQMLAAAFGDGEHNYKPVLNTLLGSAEESGVEKLEGDAFRREFIDFMLRFWRARAADSPAVIVFDDLHWSDPASAALLKELLAVASDAPILLIGLTRPERAGAGWEIRAAADEEHHHRYTEINLHPLSNEDSNQLVDSLLTISDLPQELRQRVLDKSQGNPFFVEEIVRTLIDNGAVERDESGDHWVATGDSTEIDIPDNLQALLVARIDRLEEAARRVLQLGALIGRSFFYRVLQEIAIGLMQLREASVLDEQLHALQKLDLIREAARLPELEYMFRHALTQEAAYSTILHKQRREYHLRVGEVMEVLFSGQLDEYAARLAQHFDRGRDFERAVRYYVRAADNAFRLYANAEAISQYKRALHLIDASPEVEIDSDLLGHILRQCGRALELSGEFGEALQLYGDIVLQAHEAGDKQLELAALMEQAKLFMTMNPMHDGERGQAASNRALALAQEIGDMEAESRIHWNLQLCHLYNPEGVMRESITHGELALAGALLGDNREYTGYILNDLTKGYMNTGQLARAQETVTQAMLLWREIGNISGMTDAFLQGIVIPYLLGNFEYALEYIEEAEQVMLAGGDKWGQAGPRIYKGLILKEFGKISEAVAESLANIEVAAAAGNAVTESISNAHLAWIYSHLGEPKLALEHAQKGVGSMKASFPAWGIYPLSILSLVHIARDELPAARAAINAALELYKPENSWLWFACLLKFAEASVQMAEGDHLQALDSFENYEGFLQEIGYSGYVPDALFSRAKVLKALQRFDEAVEAARQAVALAEERGMRFLLWQVNAFQSELSSVLGEVVAAQSHRRQAGQILESIVDAITENDLREKFLHLPEVRAVLEAEEDR